MSDGKWTIDYVTQIAKTVYSDLDGNNKADAADMYAFVGDKVTGLDAYLPAFGQPLMTKDDAGYPRPKIYDLYYNSQGSYVVDDYWAKYTMFANSHSLFLQVAL